MTCDICFFFNDTATTEIYTLSLHDALPISAGPLDDLAEKDVAGVGVVVDLARLAERVAVFHGEPHLVQPGPVGDRKSTRLNSSHANISYAVFCLKKKKLLYDAYAFLTHSLS